MNHEAGFNLEHSYRHLPEIFFSDVHPTPGSKPEIVIFNDQLADELGLNRAFFKKDDGAAVLGGNKVPKDAQPIAEAYAGHQFGSFTRLGDGRAILLGEQITPDQKRYDIQLKGAGKTPYSRGGDGRAALGPMLREYMISEAVNALGIPTTRSLAVTKTGEAVRRETVLDGAIVTRVASSHLRVGTFQYAAYFGSREVLKTLADYTIQRHDPDLLNAGNPYLGLLNNVIERQAKLIAKWQQVGFIHGVMNTDNMTISGETIDYGPCAFMDTYDPATVFSSIDTGGRYSYENQPYIGGWNLTRFAESLLPILHEDEDTALNLAQKALSTYRTLYEKFWLSGMGEKLGISKIEKGDAELVERLLTLMHEHQVDYTNTFLDLTHQTYESCNFYQTDAFKSWYKQWQARLTRQGKTNQATETLMRNTNPAVIPRNYFVEEVLEAAVERSDYKPIKQLLSVLKEPYAHQAEQRAYRIAPDFKTPYQTYCGT